MRFRMAITTMLMLTATACGKPEPPAPPVQLEPSEMERRVYWASDLHDRRITVEGYIGFDNGPANQAIAIGQVLTTQPMSEGDEIIRFDLERGDSPNQLQLPVLETRNIPGVPAASPIITVDIGRGTFKDQAGQTHPLRDKVRVTGRLAYIRLGDVGFLSDEDSRSPNGRRFKVRLTDVVLEKPVP